MARVLALVPLVGRGPLVDEDLLGATPAQRAISLAVGVAADVVVVSDRGPSTPLRLPERARRLASGDLTSWAAMLDESDQVVVHDPLCPLVPEDFVHGMIEDRSAPTRIAVRPVIDTIKATHAELVSETVDREWLRIVASPVVTTGRLLRLIDLQTALGDPVALVDQLRAAGPSVLVDAPPVARRLEDGSDLRLLAALYPIRPEHDDG